MDQVPVTATRGNSYDLRELAGAFGDLGTPIPFVAAYVGVVKMDPAPILAGIGLSLIVVGTRFPYTVSGSTDEGHWSCGCWTIS